MQGMRLIHSGALDAVKINAEIAATAELSRDSLVFVEPSSLKVVHANSSAYNKFSVAKSALRAGTEIKQFLAYIARDGDFHNADAVTAVRDALGMLTVGESADFTPFRFQGKQFGWYCAPGPLGTTALVFRDRGKAQELAKALSDHKIFIQHLIDVLPTPVYLKNLDGAVNRCNGAFADLFGFTPEDVIGQKLSAILPQDLAKQITKLEEPLFEAEGSENREISFALGNEIRNALFAASSLKGPSGAIAGTIGSLVDVTSMKRAQAEVAEAAKRLTGLLQGAPVGVAISSRENGAFKFFNSTFANLLGIEGDEKATDTILLSERYRKKSLNDLDRLGELHDVELRLRRPNMPEARWVKTSIEPLSFEGEDAVLWWTSDITKQKNAARELQHKANNDVLTGLANRARFMQKLDQCEALLRGTDTGACVFILDLDGFKKLNDTHGHAAGDQVLVETARRLRRSARRAEEIARLGGDEFTLLFINKGKESEMTAVAAEILDEMTKPFMWEGHDCGISASIGFSVFDGHNCDMSEQLRRADKAMYEAKAAGKSCFRCYQPDMDPVDLDQEVNG
ncbi:diguanylate cyclase [Thalassospira sp. MA62]|nr:diguanylate cyclase [Thalassospira sp. MA62]